LDSESLITFFRTNDQTTAIVGQRQANTFLLLAAYSGHGDVPEPKGIKNNTSQKVVKNVSSKKKDEKPAQESRSSAPPATQAGSCNSVGLTVRIEINLPASGDKETYDAIFKSIKENLMDGNGV